MIFRSYRKRKALKSYQRVLGPRLRGRFGRREYYTPAEIVDTAYAYQLSDAYLCYALAMYTDRAAFDAYHVARGDAACSYDRIWHEVSASVITSDGSIHGADGREHNANDVIDAAEALESTATSDATTGYDAGGYDAGGYDAGGYDAGGFDGGGGSSD